MNDLIIGTHSIFHALNNSRRIHEQILTTDQGEDEFRKKYKKNFKDFKVDVKKLSPHDFQEESKKIYFKNDFEYHRIPSQSLLITSEIQTHHLKEIVSECQRVLALDQISDVHNGAAIFRSAVFYGVDTIIIPQSKSFGFSPAFYRIASGAVEHIKIVRTSSLSKSLNQLKDAGFELYILSEHATEILPKSSNRPVCLVVGAEETGVSHAVTRLVSQTYCLKSQGEIQSLNVSAALAISLEKCFGI